MSSSTASDEVPWDEERCVEALARLEKLHDELNKLRTLPARIMSTLAAKYLTPEEYFSKFFEITCGGSRTLTHLSQDWDSTETRVIFEYLSRHGSSYSPLKLKRSDSTKSTQFPHKHKLPRDATPLGALATKPIYVPPDSQTPKANIALIIEEFRKKHPSIQTELVAQTLDIKIQFVVDFWNLNFVIQPVIMNEMCTDFKVDLPGGERAYESIIRCIKKRSCPGNLPFLLDTINAYLTGPFIECAACREIIGSDWLHPTGRRPYVEEKNVNGIQWLPVHEECWQIGV